jgi:hypothetical protein
MCGKSEVDDRRCLWRIPAKEEVFASLTRSENGNSGRLAQVIDINEGGLSASYFGVEKLGKGISRVAIFWADRFPCHLKLPCTVVYDCAIPGEFFGPFMLRRCGVKFDNLSPDQLRQLKYFLKRCAMGTE